MNGGRFNPPGSFPVLYLCRTLLCAVAELRRLGERQAIGVSTVSEVIADAIAEEIGRSVAYRPVETDGAARAAARIAELL